MSTTLVLPEPLQAYFRASNEGAIPDMLSCFALDAKVWDEGNWRKGQSALETWLRDTRAKYAFTAEPLLLEGAGDDLTVTARVEGNFPGSPVMLRYHFELDQGLIVQLDIA